MDFQGKIALVTGASSGMGAETARLLSDGGARVFGAQRGLSDFEDIAVDFADPSSPKKAIEHIAKMFLPAFLPLLFIATHSTR